MRHRLPAPLVVSLSLLAAACGPAGGTPPAADGPVVVVVDATRSSVAVDRASGVRADGTDPVTITVTTRDASGAPVAGIDVHLTVSGSGNFFGAPAAPTGADGVATATLASTEPEQKTITVTAGAGAAAVVLADRPTVTFAPVTPPPAAVRLGFLIQPTATAAGAVITPAVRVALQDASGETVTSATAAVTVSLAGGDGAALGGTRTVAAAGGVATLDDLTVDRAGAGYTLVATSAGLVSATSGAFAVTAPPATHLGFVVQPASFSAAGAGSAQVALLDASGAVATGATGSITLTIATGPPGATLTGGGPTAAAGGRATFTLDLDQAGTYTLQASGAGLAAAVSQTFDVTAGATAVLALEGLPGATTAGLAHTVTVTARDARGNPTPAYRGTITFTSTDPQAALPGDVSFAAGDAGVTTFTDGVTLRTAGSRAVTATDAAHDAITGTAPVTVAAAAATQLVFTTEPVAVEVGAAIAPAVVVTAQDPYGNVDPAFAAAVTVSLDEAPTGAHLTGTTAVTAAGGAATFGALAVDLALAGYRLRAAGGGLTDGLSAGFAAWAGPAAGDLVITEVMHTPGDHSAQRQWLELYNASGRLLNLAGLSLTDTAAAVAPSFTVAGLTLTAPGDYFVFGAAARPYDGNPFTTDYQWPGDFVVGETAGGLVLEVGATTVATLAYDATWPAAAGRSMTLADAVAAAPTAAPHRWYWCNATTPVPGASDYGTPGAANDDCGLPAVGAYSAVTCALAWPDDIPQAGAPVVWPLSPSVAQPVTARFSTPGVTTVNPLGNDQFPYLVAALGYGASADPSTWTWLPAGASPDPEYHGGATPTPGFDASFDEAKGLLQIATPGSYRYGFRVGLIDPAAGGGVLYRYCGRTGPVSATDAAAWADFGTAEVVAPCTPSQVVISQVYAGGGNAGATYKCDFVELKNRGVNPVSVAGWSVQYASDTGSSWNRTLLPVGASVPGGGSYLVQESCGANGSDLPTPDLAGGTLAMGAAAGKIALVNSATVLAGTCPTAGVVDFVGYGPTASCAETTPTPNLSATTAAHRALSGCTDTDTNNTDFSLAPPAPLNSASAPSHCGCGS